MAYNVGNIRAVEFMRENNNGELEKVWAFGIESEIGSSGPLMSEGRKVGEWVAKGANVRIGRSGTKVHRGIIYQGVLDENARVVDGYGIARMRRKGETIRLEPQNLCGATSTARGGGRYANWQGETTDEVNCKYCLKKMADNE